MAIEIDRREAFRYLGLRGAQPDAATERAVDEAARLLDEAVEPRQVSRRFLLTWLGEGVLDIEGLRIESKALAKNLSGCGEAYLMVRGEYTIVG